MCVCVCMLYVCMLHVHIYVYAFTVVLNKEKHFEMRLENVSEKDVAFKVKTTSPGRYMVRYVYICMHVCMLCACVCQSKYVMDGCVIYL